MDYRRQSQSDFASAPSPPFSSRGKKNERPLLHQLEALIDECQSSTQQSRCWQRMRQHLLSQLACLGRHTLTAVTATAGGAFQDWSAQYRLYSQNRFDSQTIFGVVRQQLLGLLPEADPLVVAMDDSILRKTGPQIPGVSWRRDPLGPPYQVNFVRAQRVLQLSAALPSSENDSARMIPIDFQHAPTPAKPRYNADRQEWKSYREACQKTKISRKGVECIQRLRENLDSQGNAQRPLWVVVDGRFTNREVMKSIPQNTVFTGRIRSDAKLYFLPESQPDGAGRRRVYGAQAPTPEQVRQEESIPWIQVRAFAAGRYHDFKVKLLKPLRWRATGKLHDVQLMVIAPLAYRLRKKGPTLYRRPAYLICTDPQLSPEKILQAYLWRWDIEVNFREEKTLLGVGQAQVRHPNSVETVPQLAVAAYALLLIAARKAFPDQKASLGFQPPKWRTKQKPRTSTQDLIQVLRRELWAQAINANNFSHFTSSKQQHQKSNKLLPDLNNSLFYATG